MSQAENCKKFVEFQCFRIFRMVVMGNINGQFQPVLQQSAAQQIIANNDKIKSQQQQQVILQQVKFLEFLKF